MNQRNTTKPIFSPGMAHDSWWKCKIFGQARRHNPTSTRRGDSPWSPVVALFLVPFLLLFLMACGPRVAKAPESNNSKSPWFKYISAYTSGVVSKQTHIQVLFVDAVVNTVGQITLPEEFLEFTPRIKGKAEWESTRKFVFTPDEPLPPGSQYMAVLHLGKIINVPETMKDYFFKFSVIPSDFEVNIDGLSFENENDRTVQQLKGTVITADVEPSLLVERILSARQEKKTLQINWTHADYDKYHHFTIINIQRKKTQSEVLVQWDGKAIGVSRQGKRSLTVTPQGEFKVTDCQPVQENQQYIIVRFSDFLDKNQNLAGLIWLDNQQVKLTSEGNVVKVYPASFLNGSVNIHIEAGIKDIFANPLKQSTSHTVIFQNIPPQARFVGKGVILPENERLTVPFEAVNLHSLQVTAFQVYADNMGQFLQVNGLEGTEELKRVGRFLWRKTLPLSQDRADTCKWSRYSIDVTSLFKENPGSLFRLELSFNRGNSAYPGSNPENTTPPKVELPFSNDEDYKKKEYSNWDYCEDYYNYDSTGNGWQYRNDPCNDAYYDPRFNRDKVRSARNFIASNIGMAAKMGESHILHVVTTDLRSAQPLPGVGITVFNFQNQAIDKAVSDNSGFAHIKVSGIPFYISADNGKDRGYLKVNTNTCLPLSHFDVGGENVQKGLKGFIYGERGVWRPGDTIYLTFILQDKNNTLPPNHPVSMEVYNPKGQLVKTLSPEESLDRFHVFKITTDESAITGNWRARVLVGGLAFDHVLKVETVVPNRLKIEMDFGKKELVMDEMPVKAKLFSQWLHGADASNLDASVKVRYSSKPTRFARYQDFTFDDPTRVFAGGEQDVFNGQLDEKGRAAFDLNLKVDKNSPGMLDASFETRVFEEGGDFSADRVTVPFHPYNAYVGIKLPKGDESRGMLLTDTSHAVQIATLDPSGNPVSREKIEVSLYQVHWKWWWDKSGDTFGQFNSAAGIKPLASGVISTKDGVGQWKFEIKYPSWGRYLVRARDITGGHCSGKIVYIDWPGWAGRAREEKGPGATRLNFTSDKSAYTVGETAVIYLPETIQGRALVSLENGTDVLEQRWVETRAGENRFDIRLTEKMSPNIYVHVTLVQPHAHKESDNPIRLYGVIPLLVEDPGTHLRPVIETAAEFRPQQNIHVKISEEKGKAMTYTLAIVDEGLLGLTRFQTPNPRLEFYKREALGVKTWDLFDDVVGAYGGELERILAIGGDGSASEEKAKKKRRFPPVVIFAGPFTLEAGKTAVHEMKLPQYIGAVRVMAVAGHNGAYGCAEKTVPVKQDLMLLSSLPRVLRPEEEFNVPVAVFVMNPSLNTVRVKIDTGDIFEAPTEKEKTVTFTKPGDELVFFRLKTKAGVGQGRITLTASAGKFQAKEETHITVMNPNPPISKVLSFTVEPGKTLKETIKPFGLENTNYLTLEASVLPPVKLEGRLNYLIQYPHGCLEQTMSRIFPQIFLSSLLKLGEEDKKKIEHHVRVAIDKIGTYQVYNGGFSYWPSGGYQVNQWITDYTGHFMLEARMMGYHVPDFMVNKWLDFQKAAANTWTAGGNDSRLTQAYRLYTLALARQPDLGAMNRLRESGKLDSAAAIQLAAAFSLAGQSEAAEDLLRTCDYKVNTYREHSGTFGSDIRDQALILGILSQMKKTTPYTRAIVKEIINALGSSRYLNTQETSYALMALAAFYRYNPSADKFSFQLAQGKAAPENYSCETPILKKTLDNFPYPDGTTVEIKNPNSVPLFVVLYNQGVPRTQEEEESFENLSLKINYFDTTGNSIDVTDLPQGKDFVAEVEVTNSTAISYDNIVLNHLFPSGWQIHNPRFDREDSANSQSDYQDIRDDRVYTYFNLPPRGRKMFRVLLNASYSGTYYLPGVSAEAMYDASVHAVTKGYWVKVVKE